MAEETGLLDTGATESFIDHKMVVRLHLETQKLVILRPVYNVNGSANRHGTITHVTHLLVTQRHKKQRVPFYVTNLGQD
jgi:predicted aspartyl protease